MIQFIEDHRADHGVEPICRVLPIAPATDRQAIAKQSAERGRSMTIWQSALTRHAFRIAPSVTPN